MSSEKMDLTTVEWEYLHNGEWAEPERITNVVEVRNEVEWLRVRYLDQAPGFGWLEHVAEIWIPREVVKWVRRTPQ